MQFSVMQSELSDRLGAYDNTVATDLTKIKRWLNMGYQYICGKQNWPFLDAYEIVQTVTDITTGTASVAAAGSTVTFSSGPVASCTGRYIQFSSSDDWYEITAHTAGETTATISPTYGQTDALVSGTFKIRKLLYASTTPLVSYYDIKKTVNAGQLESLNRRVGDFFLPLYLDAGDPTTYIMGPLNSSSNPQFSLANPPSTVFNLMVRGVKAVTDLSADSDVPIFPSKWHDAVVDMGAHYGFTGLDDNRSSNELERAEVKIANMARVYNPDLGRHRIPGGGYEYNDGPIYTLPSNFGPMS